MMIRLRNVLQVVLVAGAMAGTIHSHALTITGLSPFAATASDNAEARVTGQGLEIHMPGQQPLTITPWPNFLPQKMHGQTVKGERQMWPAGPSEILSFARKNEQQPWLLVGSNSRRATPVVGDWQLQLINKTWFVSNGQQKKALRHSAKQAHPVKITVGKDSWCLYLLDATQPQPREGLSLEQEPRISWVAMRTVPKRKIQN